MRILIVDDSTQIRAVIKRYLSSIQGQTIEFFQADNGNHAKLVLQEQYLYDNPIDVVFLDWHMPEKTGLEFLTEVRSTEMFNKFPLVIMLSAETYPHQIDACIKHGVLMYLTKPFTEEQIHEAYEKASQILIGVRHAV